jgi:hypothetical protein
MVYVYATTRGDEGRQENYCEDREEQLGHLFGDCSVGF